jgi:PTH2 family peptidyl-tRNA hydrolase
MYKQVIVIRKDLNMRKGKMCAQAAHASLGIILDMMTRYCNNTNDKFNLYQIVSLKDEGFSEWKDSGQKKIVVGVNSHEELLDIYYKAKDAKLLTNLVTDSGLTEFKGKPTDTCVAIGPGKDVLIDKITGNFQLL